MTRSFGTAASGGDCGVREQSKCQPSRRDSIMTIMSCCRSSSSFNNSIWLESCYEGQKKAEENLVTHGPLHHPDYWWPAFLSNIRLPSRLSWIVRTHDVPSGAAKGQWGNIHQSTAGSNVVLLSQKHLAGSDWRVYGLTGISLQSAINLRRDLNLNPLHVGFASILSNLYRMTVRWG